MGKEKVAGERETEQEGQVHNGGLNTGAKRKRRSERQKGAVWVLHQR